MCSLSGGEQANGSRLSHRAWPARPSSHCFLPVSREMSSHSAFGISCILTRRFRPATPALIVPGHPNAPFCRFRPPQLRIARLVLPASNITHRKPPLISGTRTSWYFNPNRPTRKFPSRARRRSAFFPFQCRRPPPARLGFLSAAPRTGPAEEHFVEDLRVALPRGDLILPMRLCGAHGSMDTSGLAGEQRSQRLRTVASSCARSRKLQQAGFGFCRSAQESPPPGWRPTTSRPPAAACPTPCSLDRRRPSGWPLKPPQPATFHHLGHRIEQPTLFRPPAVGRSRAAVFRSSPSVSRPVCLPRQVEMSAN